MDGSGGEYDYRDVLAILVGEVAPQLDARVTADELAAEELAGECVHTSVVEPIAAVSGFNHMIVLAEPVE